MRQQQRDYPSPAELTPDGNGEPPNLKYSLMSREKQARDCPTCRDSRRRRHALIIFAVVQVHLVELQSRQLKLCTPGLD